MILLVLLVVVLAAAAATGLLGIGQLAGERRRKHSGVLPALSVPVILVGGLALVAALAVGLGGGGGDEGTGTDHESEPSTTRATAAPGRQVLPDAAVTRSTVAIPVVTIRPVDDGRFAPYNPLSGLAPGSVVRVQADGFDWSERGHVEQCVSELGHRTACGESFPVQFDDGGKADFQVAVRGDIAPGGCRAGQATCLLRLTGDASRRTATVQTVLVDRLVPGTVRVEPARGIADGQTVDVAVAGFQPGATATAVLCAPPGPYDADRCAAPGATSTFTVDSTGTGRTTLVVRAGRLGPESARCGPRRPCGVAVVVGPGFVAAPAATVAFTLGPGVDYEAGRLLPGLLCALVLASIIVAIVLRTDWTKPGEAATPALDGADLRSGQSLDDLFGTDQELEARDPVPW